MALVDCKLTYGLVVCTLATGHFVTFRWSLIVRFVRELFSLLQQLLPILILIIHIKVLVLRILLSLSFDLLPRFHL